MFEFEVQGAADYLVVLVFLSHLHQNDSLEQTVHFPASGHIQLIQPEGRVTFLLGNIVIAPQKTNQLPSGYLPFLFWSNGVEVGVFDDLINLDSLIGVVLGDVFE